MFIDIRKAKKYNRVSETYYVRKNILSDGKRKVITLAIFKGDELVDDAAPLDSEGLIGRLDQSEAALSKNELSELIDFYQLTLEKARADVLELNVRLLMFELSSLCRVDGETLKALTDEQQQEVFAKLNDFTTHLRSNGIRKSRRKN